MDGAEYIVSIKKIDKAYKDIYLCAPCCRDLEKIDMIRNIRRLKDGKKT